MQLIFFKKNPKKRTHEHDENDEESMAIKTIVNKIWDQYDEDESGELDFEETF